MAAVFGNNVGNICGEMDLNLDASVTYKGLHVGAVSIDTIQVTNVVNDNCDEEFNLNASITRMNLNDAPS